VVSPKSREFECAKWASGLGEDAQSFLSRLASGQTQGDLCKMSCRLTASFPALAS
jgi:hypothetical protein